MSTPSGSPRGTIRLWPNNVTEEEINSKGGLKDSIQQELNDMYEENEKTASDNDQWMPKSNYSPTINTRQDLHPFVNDLNNQTPYLWTVYPTHLAGTFKVTLQGLTLNNEKAIWKFWGDAKDFIHKLQKQFPEIKELIIPRDEDILPNDIGRILFKEGNKIGVKIIEYLYLDTVRGVVEKDVLPSKVLDTEGYGSENLKNDALDPSTHSKLTDPGNQTFQVALGSREERLIKIAMHIIKTPIDENPDNNINKAWSVVPDKPSDDDEKEGIEYFRTRDEAAAWLNKKEESKTGSIINAHIMNEWFEPEEAAKFAWNLRKKEKTT
jgi:hypothetical protein